MIEVPAPCSTRHYNSLNNFSARMLESKVMPADGLHRQWWRPAGMLQLTATHCNALQRTATHCNALQRTATHCNARQHTETQIHTTHSMQVVAPGWYVAAYCNALHCTAAHCNTLQFTVIHTHTHTVSVGAQLV